MDQSSQSKKEFEPVQQPKCGIVMPISPLDGLSKEHWGDVLSILKEAISSAGFESNLVSDADEVSIIQKTIVQNLYSNEIVVCDVSGKNPNVMFELGMRLAFDKPTIIIKDDKTDFTFDTSIIEHLTYPRDLRFTSILLFKELLSKKVKATYQKASKDTNYTTFLKHFGEFKVAQISQKEISSEQFVVEALKDLQLELREMKHIQNSNINRNRDIIANSELNAIVKVLLNEFMTSRGVTKNDLRKIELRKVLISEISQTELVKSLMSKGAIDELHLNNLITSYLVS